MQTAYDFLSKHGYRIIWGPGRHWVRSMRTVQTGLSVSVPAHAISTEAIASSSANGPYR
jgi:hypothetical protein